MRWDSRIDRDHFPGILMQQYSPEEQRLIGEPELIFRGTELGFTEAPHMYYVNGWYYLMTAEGGTSQGHAITMARSRSMHGPFEVDPENPMLTARDAPDWPLQYAGHGDLVQAADGAWVLPEPAGDWFPSDSSMLGEYLAAAEAMPEPAAVMPQADFEAHMLALSDGKTAEELTIDTFPDVLAEDAALESFLRDTPEDAALCCATYLVENMWYGDGENEPYTTDLALTALGRLYVLSMQYLMETYNDSTSLLSALLLHTFSPEEWLYQLWGVVGGIAFAKEGFTLDSVYYDEHPIEKQCMTALLRSPKRLYVATLFDYVNPVDNERCDADHFALYDFLAEGKADDRLHIEPAGAAREDLLAACTETAHWEVEGGTDTTILHITPEHGQELRLVYRFGEN